jgi:dolichyl-phosphate beta-glucosyltransferase
VKPIFLEIVVPAYNESERIVRTLERIREYYDEQDYTWRCSVVNDGSTDNTADLVLPFTRDEQFRLLDYGENRGKGAAVRFGMLRAEAELVLFCDADLATPQEETAKLLAAIEGGVAVAIGSRPKKESSLEIRQPWFRERMGRAFNKVVQLLGVRGIEDTQCGFKIFTSAAAKDVFSRCKLNGFSFDIEALMVARDLGYQIAEVPIRWRHQEGSKVVLMRDGPRMLKDLLKLRLAGRTSRLAKNESA